MMQEYIQKLIECGYSPCKAFFIYHKFVNDLGLDELDSFIKYLRRTNYVDPL